MGAAAKKNIKSVCGRSLWIFKWIFCCETKTGFHSSPNLPVVVLCVCVEGIMMMLFFIPTTNSRIFLLLHATSEWMKGLALESVISWWFSYNVWILMNINLRDEDVLCGARMFFDQSCGSFNAAGWIFIVD